MDFFQPYLIVSSILLFSNAAFSMTLWTTETQPGRMQIQEELIARFTAKTGIEVKLVPQEEEEHVLSPWGLKTFDAEGNSRLAKERLPKILINDPAVQVLKEMEESVVEGLPAGWLTNRVVKVVRYSRSAGSAVAYRLIVEAH